MTLSSRVLAVTALGAATPVVALAAPASTLEPAGGDAALIATLFWWMALGAAIVWTAAMAFLVYCLVGARAGYRLPSPSRVVVGGGVLVPVGLLSGLLAMTLPSIETLVDEAPSPTQRRVRVVGEQWWWRVTYVRPDGATVTGANELRVPLGQRTQVELSSDNVIHSFWVPSLAGKVDMIPGRLTYLSMEPTKTGRYRGICAEYCGTSHARMTFDVVVEEPEAFDAWLRASAAPAAVPATVEALAGARTFTESGCGACHTVRGTGADGTAGPDLTHVAGREGPVRPTRAASGELDAWLSAPGHRKPGVLMPPFAALGPPRLASIGAYLRELR